MNAGNVPAGSNFTLTAQYFNTFVLEQVGLFDANDNPIPQWTLTDLITKQNEFDQTGRVAGNAFARCSPPIAEAADEGPAAPDRSY